MTSPYENYMARVPRPNPMRQTAGMPGGGGVAGAGPQQPGGMPSFGQALGGLFGQNMMPFYAAMALGGTRQDQGRMAVQALQGRNEMAQQQGQFDRTFGLQERELGLAEQAQGALERYNQQRLALEQQQLARAGENPFTRAIAQIDAIPDDALGGSAEAASVRETMKRELFRSMTTEGRGSQFSVNIPSGYMPTMDDAGRVTGIQPIPGSPQEREMLDAQRARGRNVDNRSMTNDIVFSTIDRAAERVTANPFATTGIGGRLLRQVPGTDAFDAGELVDTIRANIGFDRLQQMRDASPTGGALGQVSERELAQLERTLSSLELSQSYEQFMQNLGVVRDAYLDIIHGRGVRPDGIPPMPGSVVADPDSGMSYRFKGGDPSRESSWERVR